MDNKEIGCEDVDCILCGTHWGPVADSCEQSNGPSGSIKGGEYLDYVRTISFSRRTLVHGVSSVHEAQIECL
jgi:hypothetical protein